jgi:RHS repeat-associated protein
VRVLSSPHRIKASHRRRWKGAAGRFVQRYYDPIIGRFLSVDPVSASDNGANFNRYWYANNNPYKFTDADGRLACMAGSLCIQGSNQIGQEGGGNQPDWRHQFDLAANTTKPVVATPAERRAFVSDHKADATKAAAVTGNTTAEILGASALESTWGKSRFAKDGNNFFGLHAPAMYQTGAIPAGVCCVKMATFSSFFDSAKSFVDKNSYLTGVTDPKVFAKDLQVFGKFGINKDGTPVPGYQAGVVGTVHSVQTLLDSGH